MTYITTRPPVAEPMGVSDVKAHMRIGGEAEDACLAGLVRVAREHMERATGLCLVSQGLRLVLPAVSRDGVVQILKGPVQAIDAVTLYDADGVARSLAAEGMAFEREGPPARLWLGRGFEPGQAENGVEIDFTAGFGEAGADVPDSLRRALLLHVAAMYEYRGAVGLADQPAAIPDGYERLVQPFLGRRL